MSGSLAASSETLGLQVGGEAKVDAFERVLTDRHETHLGNR